MCSWGKVFWKHAVNLEENTHVQVWFNKVALQLYWNHTSAWLFSCKFAAYLRTTFTRNTSGELRLSKLTKLWWLLVEMWYHLAVLRDLVPFILSKMWEAPIEECYFKSSCRLKGSKFIKSNTPPWVFFSFFKLCKCTTHHPLSFGLELIQLDQYHLNQL